MVKIKICICTMCIAILGTAFSGCKSYKQSRKQNQKLYNAIETNELEAAKEAIDDGANKNSFQNVGLTMESISGKPDKNPVYADTAMHEDNKIAQYLVKNDANPNYKDKDGISLLMLAAQQGNIKFCKQLVEAGADVKYKKGGASALDYALSTREIQDAKTQIELIEYLYKQKTPVTKVTKSILIKGYRTGVYGDTPANSEYILQWGIKQGIVKTKDLSKERKIFYKILIGQEINSSILKGISVNKLYNTYGENIAMVAARYGNLKVLKYAVKNNISIRKQNENFENIFDLAIKSNDMDTIKYVMDTVKPSQKDICEAVENSIDSISQRTLKCVLTKLTDINTTPKDNDENILETAVKSGRIDFVEVLIKKEAEVTPMALTNAVNTGNIKLVKLLLSNGGEVNKIGKYSDGEKMNSALYEAITAGDFPMVKFLIKEGANETDIKEAIADSNSYRIKKYIYQRFPNCKR